MCCPHHWRVRLCKRCSGGRCWTRTDGTSHWPGTFCWRWRPRSVGPDHCPPAPGCRWSSPSCRSAQTESSPACHPAGLVQKMDMTQNMKLCCQINSVSNPPIIPYEHTVRLRISRLSFSRSENYIWFQRVVKKSKIPCLQCHNVSTFVSFKTANRKWCNTGQRSSDHSDSIQIPQCKATPISGPVEH